MGKGKGTASFAQKGAAGDARPYDVYEFRSSHRRLSNPALRRGVDSDDSGQRRLAQEPQKGFFPSTRSLPLAGYKIKVGDLHPGDCDLVQNSVANPMVVVVVVVVLERW